MAAFVKPRRQGSRWLNEDCPREVLCILDAGKRTFDRWTVVYQWVYESGTRTYLFGRGMSDNPTSPGGVGLSFQLEPYQVVALRNRQRSYRWSDLPPGVQDCIRRDCLPEGLGARM